MTASPNDVETMNIEAHTIEVEVNGKTFPVVDHGGGDPVLLLHGFPDSRHLWRYQIPALAEMGRRVIAPDLKGYGEAPKPQAEEDYSLSAISEETLGMLDALEIEEAAVVGHDWGAALAWVLTAYNQERVNRMAVLSVGAPGIPAQYTLEQFMRSWYVQFFQEDTAEAWLLRNDAEMLRDFLQISPDADRYLEDLTRPGALSAALNWYRANWDIPHPDEADIEYPPLDLPVMGVWSEGDDEALREKWMRDSEQVVEGPWHYERISDASHWMMLDRPEKINGLLIDFLEGEIV